MVIDSDLEGDPNQLPIVTSLGHFLFLFDFVYKLKVAFTNLSLCLFVFMYMYVCIGIWSTVFVCKHALTQAVFYTGPFLCLLH